MVQWAKKHHPDMNKDDPDAEKTFQEINKAYEVRSSSSLTSYLSSGHLLYILRDFLFCFALGFER